MERFSMDKAEVFVKDFIAESHKRTYIRLSNDLMYMEYLLEEVKSRVSHSELELLILESISKCKDLLEEKS